jgi:hypothetical protein
MEDKIIKKECKHTGKFKGVGQSVINAGNVLMVITSCVCGECGRVRISVNNIKVEGLKPMGIATPKFVMPFPKRP